MNISIKTLLCLLLLYVQIENKAFCITVPKNKEIRTESSFIGKWIMKTIVTQSNCPDILVGSTTESKLTIKIPKRTKIKHNYFKAHWKGGAWKKSTGIIKLLNNKEAITERITNIKVNKTENWKAVLIDHLNLEENNTIKTNSIIIQYKNGEIVGEYKTYSILTRVK